MAHEEQDVIDGWTTYHNWLDDMRESNRIINEYDESLELRQKILNCSDNKERFNLIWSDNKIKNEINNIYQKNLKVCVQKIQSRTPKSAEESKRLRELGNKFFKEGDYHTALKHYTQAIRFAPSNLGSSPETIEESLGQGSLPKDDTLALALANRSAALYAMNRFRVCIADIDLAIKFGYPETNSFKLMIRKLKCLHILSIWVNDVEEIKEKLGRIMRNPKTKDYIKTEINNMFEFLDQPRPEDIVIDEIDVVDEIAMKITNGAKRIPNCADCVEMSYAEDKGRFLMVNKDCSIGRLVVAEEPYVCNLAPSKRDDYCYNCFAKLHDCGLSCPNCIQVFYCSESCLTINQKIHQYECNKCLDFQDKIGVAYIVAHLMFKLNFNLKRKFPMQTKKEVIQMEIDRILKLDLNDWPDYIYRSDYCSVLGLGDHVDGHNCQDMFGYILTANYLVICFLDLLSKIDSKLSLVSYDSEDDQILLGSLVLKHLLQLQTNLISIVDQNLQNLVVKTHTISGVEEHPIGIGIYPAVSLLNHSCQPNIMSIFHRNKFVGRATQSLPCGTEVKFCYGPNMVSMTKKDRQQRLREQYFFDCKCDCCSTNTENECRALLCPECDGPLIYNQDLTHQCLKCEFTGPIDIKTYLKDISDIQKELNGLETSQINPSLKIKQLVDIEKKLKKLAYWKHPDFIRIKSSMSEYAQEMDDVNAALNYCEEELKLCDKTFAVDSYRSIMTKLKVINLKWQNLYNQIEESSTTIDKEKGVQELKSLIGTIIETRTKLRELLSATNIKGADSSYAQEIGLLNGVQRNINQYLKYLEDGSKSDE